MTGVNIVTYMSSHKLFTVLVDVTVDLCMSVVNYLCGSTIRFIHFASLEVNGVITETVETLLYCDILFDILYNLYDYYYQHVNISGFTIFCLVLGFSGNCNPILQ